jgi:hypothetical protein
MNDDRSPFTSMSSKERMLNAIHHRPVDHVPLLLRFWSLGGEDDHIPFNWQDEVSRVEHTTALGLDDTILLQPPLGYVENYDVDKVPNVISSTEILPVQQGDRYPKLIKRYHTPAGDLQTVVNITEDWPHGLDIHLFDDYNIPRLIEPLIKTVDDIQCLKYLFADPQPEQVEAFRCNAQFLRQEAERLGVLLDGGWSALGDSAMWLCGMERILYGQMDDPNFIESVLDAILEWELRRIDQVLALGVDEWVHMAWYEGTDFWTPRNYRRLLRPRLQKLINHVHAAGIPFRYIITKGWKPISKDLLEMGIDCLTGVDPVQDQIYLKEVKKDLGSQICIMGGVNSVVMLSQWN